MPTQIHAGLVGMEEAGSGEEEPVLAVIKASSASQISYEATVAPTEMPWHVLGAVCASEN